MKHPWQIWTAFAGCLAVMISAVGWLTVQALELDRAEALARQQAVLEENVRLALWRMDSAVAPLLARESARPWSSRQVVASGDRAAPQTAHADPPVLFRFQFDSAGRLTSPQMPTGPRSADDQSRPAERLLNRIARLTDAPALRRLLPQTPVLLVESSAPFAQAPAEEELPSPDAGRRRGEALSLAEARSRDGFRQQYVRSQQEYQARSQFVAQNNVVTQQSALSPQVLDESFSSDGPLEAQAAVMTPLWIDGELLMARAVRFGGRDALQGCLLDWPALRDELLSSVRDLLPEADLQPVVSPPAVEQARRLASLPLRLEPGRLGLPADPGLSPVRFALLLTWGTLLLAIAAVAVLLRGVLALSERRGAFVSAVTHELRTPLTTFRLYADMLAEGMVPDDRRRSEYLQTLRSEADRLMHLVENVLAYARLERGNVGSRCRPVRMSELLDLTTSRLADRARLAEMQFRIEADETSLDAVVLTDPAAVEQVLFNLVDNACKYAAPAADRTLHLQATAAGRCVQLRLVDHGPGIPADERRRLFRPFHKSAHDAADSAPGVGLGLALSRRLARDLHGELRLENADPPGAAFVLELPRARRDR